MYPLLCLAHMCSYISMKTLACELESGGFPFRTILRVEPSEIARECDIINRTCLTIVLGDCSSILILYSISNNVGPRVQYTPPGCPGANAVSNKGVGTGGARGAMAPTLLKTVDFGPPTFQ